MGDGLSSVLHAHVRSLGVFYQLQVFVWLTQKLNDHEYRRDLIGGESGSDSFKKVMKKAFDV
jgi:hypothetical protein